MMLVAVWTISPPTTYWAGIYPKIEVAIAINHAAPAILALRLRDEFVSITGLLFNFYKSTLVISLRLVL